MARKGTGLFVAGLLAVTAALPAAGQGTATPPPAGIASQQVVEIEGGQVLTLSPDGQWIGALIRGDDTQSVCSFSTATLTEEICLPFEGAGVAPDSVAWSPDSTRFAFTEDVLRYLDEGDIWLFDRKRGDLVDLTDDGVTGGFLGAGEEGTLIDVAPAWSPDGTELVFARSAPTGDLDEDGDDLYETTLLRMSADGGEPTPIATVGEERLWVPAGICWQEDGTIFYTVNASSGEDDNGLWSVPVHGGEPEQLASAADFDVTSLTLVDVSVGGLGLLLDRSGTGFMTIDLAGGEVEPITIGADQPITPLVTGASFSPDGGSLLMAVSVPGEGFRLVLRDLETGTDTILGDLDGTIGQPLYFSSLQWAPDGVVFGPSAGRTGLLIWLATD